MLLSHRARQGKMVAQMSLLYLMSLLSPQLISSFIIRNSKCSSSHLISSLFNAAHHHYHSYDMNLRLTILFHDPPLENPVEVLTAATLFHLTGFCPGKFEEILDSLLLIPDIMFYVWQREAHVPNTLHYFCCCGDGTSVVH
jgi:hypothetical protein